MGLWLTLVSASLASASVDVNGNGLSDVWENLYPTAQSPLADPDGDGRNNLQESIAGTDPLDAGSGLWVQAQLLSQSLAVFWPSVVGRQYYLESNSNYGVGPWEKSGPLVEGTGGEVLGIAPGPVPQGTLLRVRVHRQEPQPAYVHEALTPDTDGDGVSDLREFFSGTDPFVAQSVLRVSRVEIGPALWLQWPGVRGKSYRVESRPATATGDWSALSGRLTGTGEPMAVALPAAAQSQWLRLRVTDDDTDGDGVSDWEEIKLGSAVGLFHYRTNFPTSPAAVSARLNATNLITLRGERAIANVTRAEPGAVRFVRQGNLSPLTLHFAVGGEAVPGVDYHPLNGTVTLPAGAAEVIVPIVPLTNAAVAPARAVTLTLLPGAGYEVGDPVSAQVNVVREVALSVRDFGALGDGEADDTIAIQTAIVALEGSPFHNTLHFPAGTYRLGSVIAENLPNYQFNRLLRLGLTDLRGRDLFFTGAPGARLYSPIHEVRAHILAVPGTFRSLSFRDLHWARTETALPATTGEPNQAAGVFVFREDLRRLELLEFDGCTFDNCHGAVEVFGWGFDLRGRLADFRFVRCGVTNLFGPNTTNSTIAYGGGQQVRVSSWVGRALYTSNYFDGGSLPPDLARNPGGRRKDGCHFGSPLQLIFTNNVVRYMEAEAIHQNDDPYMATVAENFVIPPADGTPGVLRIFPVSSTFSPGQVLNCRTWFDVGPPTNVFLSVVAFDAASWSLTVTNPGITESNVVGWVIPPQNSIYLSDYNPTDVLIADNLVESGFPGALAGITANARAVIRGNTIVGCQNAVFNYPSDRTPLHPAATGMVIENNVILTQDAAVWPYYATGILNYGPGARIANNFIVTPQSLKFRGIVCRDNDAWVEGNTLVANAVTHYGYDSGLRSMGIAFTYGSTGGMAAANRTRGMDTGVGPEGPYQEVPHRVILHQSLDDVLPVDPVGLQP